MLAARPPTPTETRRSVRSPTAAASAPTSPATSSSRVVAAVWSCDPAVSLQYPARYLFEFLDHHGMLTVFGSPTWRTVTGGSQALRRGAVAAGIADVRLATPVQSVVENADGVVVTDAHGVARRLDSVVIAAHPHQALAMLAQPTRGPAGRARRDAILRATSPSCTPTSRCCRGRSGARASWNYWRRAGAAGTGVLVTYDLTRLQRLDVPDRAIPRDTERRGLRRPATGHRHDALRAPPLHAGIRCGAAPSARRSTPRASPSPAPTTAGGSTRTAPAPVSSRRPPWASVDRAGTTTASSPASRSTRASRG